MYVIQNIHIQRFYMQQIIQVRSFDTSQECQVTSSPVNKRTKYNNNVQTT